MLATLAQARKPIFGWGQHRELEHLARFADS
jgi:hypothetical protein